MRTHLYLSLPLSHRHSQLLKQLDDLKNELATLRVAKVSGQGGPSKLTKIRVVRKAIARVLTVYNQTRLDHLRKAYRKKSFKPTDLRQKKTRAIRRRLSTNQLNKRTVRAQKKESNFPPRRYALKQ